MKFLCDVHISIKVAKHLANAGHTAFHANSLPAKWYSFFLRSTPRKLVRVLLGNISNAHLIELLDQYLPEIGKLDGEGPFYVELGERLTAFTPENS